MYERILVAIDFSDPSVDALRWTARHFPEARITLFHALEEVDAPAYLMRTLGEELDLQLESELDVQTNLEVLAHEVGIEPRILIRRGWPPRQIRRAAEDEVAGLIVLGSPRQRMWSFQETGTTATRAVERGGPPVLVWRPVPRRADPEDRTVLAAVDLHEGSASVADVGARFARHFGARLVLCHVLTRTLQAYLRHVSSPAVMEETLLQLQNAARQEALGLVPPELRDELEVRAVVTRGRPWTQILAAAEAESANLVVIGSGRSAAGRALLGGVTERVLRASNSSVLTVPL